MPRLGTSSLNADCGCLLHEDARSVRGESAELGVGFGASEDPTAELPDSWIEAAGRIADARARAKLLSLTVDATDYTGPAENFGRGWARARMWSMRGEPC